VSSNSRYKFKNDADEAVSVASLTSSYGGYINGRNSANLELFIILYSYESEFPQKLVKDKKIHEARAFNFTYRYIDDVLSINNSRFAEFLPLIYPPELEVKETTYPGGTIRTHWYADDLLKQYPSKGDKYVIDEEL
jgi:hypothetical protein